LDDLVEKSGIEIPVKPKYYQGLSVHGRKRADWANEGREVQSKAVGAQHPPLLYAAWYGSLESVEWFSSDTALRCYSDFADSHRDDIRIQNLAKTERGLQSSITKWLDLRSHLLLHSVVLGKTNEQSLNLLRHLCEIHPKALEHRSANGMTPLQLAFALHRIEMVRPLLEAGADQTTRDNTGANIVHSIFNNINRQNKSVEQTRELLGLIDARLLSSLFTERTTDMPGAATPLARWLHVASIGSSVVPYNEEVLKLILEFSKGEDLSIVNGEGDTPIHAMVRRGADALLRIMLQCCPGLLFRENASGRTPFEMAKDTYLDKLVFSNPPSLSASGHLHSHRGHRRRARGQRNSMLARDPKSFVEEPDDTRSGKEKVWEVCKEFAKKSEGQKRQLVSLVEANEVAKRLALRERSSSAMDEEDEDEEDEEDEERVAGDEVNAWFQEAIYADR
jgi:hypothetical protein